MLLFFVIPGLTRNPLLFKTLRYWMPDQVRHDLQKLNAFLNYDAVFYAGMTEKHPTPEEQLLQSNLGPREI
jgi:hypothetical protein